MSHDDNTHGEFQLIGQIATSFAAPKGTIGIGDDCAVLPQEQGYETLVTCDLLVEDTHFLFDQASPRQIGWKAAAVNFSDIAAMGGVPVGTFLSMALPPKVGAPWVAEFIEGYRSLSDLLHAPLLGGDTTSSPQRVCINVTVLGQCRTGRRKLRSTAQAGDLVCVTGPLGDSAAGLHAILHHAIDTPEAYALVERHYHPTPRIDEGQQLAAHRGVHAMMDISDGIGSDLRHILDASHVGATIEVGRIPLTSHLQCYCQRHALDPYELALTGGEDYELLFTIDPHDEPGLGVPHHIIGHITPEQTLRWLGSDRDYRGYVHNVHAD